MLPGEEDDDDPVEGGGAGVRGVLIGGGGLGALEALAEGSNGAPQCEQSGLSVKFRLPQSGHCRGVTTPVSNQ